MPACLERGVGLARAAQRRQAVPQGLHEQRQTGQRAHQERSLGRHDQPQCCHAVAAAGPQQLATGQGDTRGFCKCLRHQAAAQHACPVAPPLHLTLATLKLASMLWPTPAPKAASLPAASSQVSARLAPIAAAATRVVRRAETGGSSPLMTVTKEVWHLHGVVFDATTKCTVTGSPEEAGSGPLASSGPRRSARSARSARLTQTL